MGEKNNTELVEDSLKMAAVHRGDIKGVLLHSDQGAQYASTSYQNLLSDWNSGDITLNSTSFFLRARLFTP
jgi:transposase InsO family protein